MSTTAGQALLAAMKEDATRCGAETDPQEKRELSVSDIAARAALAFARKLGRLV